MRNLKCSMIKTASISLISTLFLSAPLAHATGGNQTYKLRVTNGSAMPISPAVVYVKLGNAPLTKVGQMPTSGFTHLCQTGNPDERFQEVKDNASVKWVQKTSGLLLPGETVELSVPVRDVARSSIHFEGMYGKTKDTCAVFGVSAHELSKNVKGDLLIGRDEVLSTGVFKDPTLPENTNSICTSAPTVVDCLRELAGPASGAIAVRYFPGYLPNTLGFLEEHYGAEETQTLVIPTSGAVRFQLIKN